MTVIYYMSIDRADKPWIGNRRLTEAVYMTTMGKKFENRTCPIMELYPQGRLRRQTYYMSQV